MASTTTSQRRADEVSTATLRGASVLRPRQLGRVAGALGLLGLALVIALSALAAAHDNARLTHLRTSGVAVNVTLSACQGNLGGSGSNTVDYTCRGTFNLDGATHHALIGPFVAFQPNGSHVAAVVDPRTPSSLMLASVLKATHPSSRVYLMDGALGVLLLVLTGFYVRFLRRARRKDSVVETMGLEPTTSGLQSPRSTN